jgi:SAM-dependent methyltransferase
MNAGPSDRPPGSQPLPKDSDWLFPFLAGLRSQGSLLLDAGCGPGIDAATLCSSGFTVVGFDRSARALSRARAVVPRATLVRADLSAPLPFRDATFDGALSSLALHYHPWAETRAAFAEIRRVLRPGAPFLFRVNATDDFYHGAGDGEVIESNFYRQPGAHHAGTKRFYDEAMVRAAVDGLFTVEHLAHVSIHRYEHPKQAWECFARSV